MAPPLVLRADRDLIPVDDHNDILAYIENGTYRVNTSELEIAGVSIIDSSGNITSNVGTVDGRNIATDGVKLDTISENANTSQFEMFTIDATSIANKYVELAGTVTDNQSIRVFIDNIGIKAEQGVDYSVSGNQIFWESYEFQNLLEIGDKLKIVFV